jgi:GTPase SAR1 family protein
MTSQYFRGVRVGIVVYSVDNLKSFQAVQPWIARLRAEEPDARIWIVGNKADVDSGTVLDARGLVVPRAVTFESGAARARLCTTPGASVSFVETSALTGAGVDELFSQITNIIRRDDAFARTLTVPPKHDLADLDAAAAAGDDASRGCRC